MIKLQIFTILCLFAILEAAKLPTYLTQCKLSDPDLNACFKRNGNKAIPDVAKGDIHYDIPSALPLRVQGPIVSKDNNQELVLTDLQIYGLETARIETVDLNLEKGVFLLNLEIPSITALASCHAIGNYFGYAVSNHEYLNEKLVGTQIYYNTNFTTSAIDEDNYFTDLDHTEKLRSQGQFNEFFRGLAPLKVHKTVCQEKFPEIIEEQIGIYLFTIFKSLADRVSKPEVFLP